MGCEWEHTKIEKNIDRHQGTGDATEALVDTGAFRACCALQSDCFLFSCYRLYFLYWFCCVSGFLLLAHGEAPLSN